VHILDISGGFNGIIVPGNAGPGFFAPLSKAVKQKVSVPVIVTGGIKEAAQAEEILARGDADLIGVGRAILADSGWAKRNLETLK
jgi:NADPH2 dehydrogenase